MPFDYDGELVCYQRRLHSVLDIGPDDLVLDVGCGTGQATREAARVASRGSALGVDVSAPMLERARRQAEIEGVGNVEFLQADAQSHPFPAEHFTVALSRFGTMFFADPMVAFTNIGRALRPGAPFVQLVWQAREHQEWSTAIRAALSSGDDRTPSADAAFSLADPKTTADVLTSAGFTTIEVTDLHEPVHYGATAAEARESVLQLLMAAELLSDKDTAVRRSAMTRLDATLAAHDTDNGVWFDSRAWLVTARRG